MPSLRTKPKDAQGKPIDATTLYEALTPHARGFKVFNPSTVLRGDDPDLTAASELWIRTDATTPEKRNAIAAYVARRRSDVPEPLPDPLAPRILGQIPPERRRVALRNYHDRSGQWFEAGQVYDLNDPFVKANQGDLFGPVPDEAA